MNRKLMLALLAMSVSGPALAGASDYEFKMTAQEITDRNGKKVFVAAGLLGHPSLKYPEYLKSKDSSDRQQVPSKGGPYRTTFNWNALTVDVYDKKSDQLLALLTCTIDQAAKRPTWEAYLGGKHKIVHNLLCE